MSSIFTIDYNSIVKEVSEHKNYLVKSADSSKLASDLVYLVQIRYKLLNTKCNSSKLTIADLKVRIHDIEKLIKLKKNNKDKILKEIEEMMIINGGNSDSMGNNDTYFEGLGESIVHAVLNKEPSQPLPLLAACSTA